MLKWAVTSRGFPTLTSGSGSPVTSSDTDSYVSAPRATAWPTYNDVSVAQPRQARWSTQWLLDDDSDDEYRDDSLSAYNENSYVLEQMMTIDFNDDSQVCVYPFIPTTSFSHVVSFRIFIKSKPALYKRVMKLET